MNVENINIMNVKPEDIKVLVWDYSTFSSVNICIGTSRISLFVQNATEASAVVASLCTSTRTNHAPAPEAISEYA